MTENKSHKYFFGTKDFSHEYYPKVGVLCVNLGTPDAPTTKDVRVYLREFLSDPRIIELPQILWQPLLQVIILATRPPKVAKLYQSIWTEGGSPLLVYGKSLVTKLRKLFTESTGTPMEFALGMRYGNPSISSALHELKEKNCNRIIVVPLFGQYSSTTVGSVMDALFAELTKWRWVPDIRTISCFHDHPAYIKCLGDKIKTHWKEHGQNDKLLMSFHGVPKRYVEAGDPYSCQCRKTARLLAEYLGLNKDQYVVSFQSQFGKEEWVKPATDATLESLAKEGLESVDVICPGFLADCLETLEEIEEENKDIFLENGGKSFSYISCLNDSDEWVSALHDIISENSLGWIRSKEQWDESEYRGKALETEKQYANLCPYKSAG